MKNEMALNIERQIDRQRDIYQQLNFKKQNEQGEQKVTCRHREHFDHFQMEDLLGE